MNFSIKPWTSPSKSSDILFIDITSYQNKYRLDGTNYTYNSSTGELCVTIPNTDVVLEWINELFLPSTTFELKIEKGYRVLENFGRCVVVDVTTSKNEIKLDIEIY